MRNAIILHGWPSKKEYYSDDFKAPDNAHWLPWIQVKLLQEDIYAETPTMPDAHIPKYDIWKKAVERSDHIGPDTIIVGHSCGGGFWIKYLSENPNLKVGKIVLVAPWLDPDDELGNDFFKNFDIDPNIVSRTKGFTIFRSDNDEASIDQSIKRIKSAINNVKIVDFHNYGHFCYKDMQTEEFPELLAEVLS